jgi:tRNA(fMet)-specific endonuclease VapC
MNRLLLDTSAYSALMRGSETVRELIGRADELFLNSVILGELLAGFEGGTRARRNRGILDDFLSNPRVASLAIDDETAERYAVILNHLRRAGTPIPTNDIWIAASAMQHGLKLLTADRHFLSVPQVVVELLS